MGAVRRITEDYDVVSSCKVEKLRGIVRAMPVHEEDSARVGDDVQRGAAGEQNERSVLRQGQGAFHAKFFEDAFGMTRAGNAQRGVYMTDGIFNVALLKKEGDEKLGLYHFGMWVDDLDEAEKKVVDAGGKYLAGRPTSPNSFYEAKYKSPTGLVFDLTHKGWAGAVKDVVPQK